MHTAGNAGAAREAIASTTFLGKWGSPGSGDGQFSEPWDLDVAPDGSVYVADGGNHRIQRFTADGGFLGKWGGYGTFDGRFNWPIDVTVAPDGSVYVADTDNHRIQQFTADGRFVRKWGTPGSGDGQFNEPISVAAAEDGRIYVADDGNRRVQQFAPDGGFLGKWTPRWGIAGPWGVAVAPDGSVYVTPVDSPSRTQRFTADGAWYQMREGTIPYAKEVDVARDGSVYIAVDDYIQWFTAGGRFIGQWGGSGSGDGQFSRPIDVAAAPNGEIYVSDQQNHRIQRFSAPSSDIGFLQLYVFDSGFIDLGEHHFAISPPPTRASAKPPPPGNVTVPTGDYVFLEFPTDTTVEISEKVDSWWHVESTKVSPTDELRKCRPQAPNKVCAHISGGAAIEVTFNNRRTGPTDPDQ